MTSNGPSEAIASETLLSGFAREWRRHKNNHHGMPLQKGGDQMQINLRTSRKEGYRMVRCNLARIEPDKQNVLFGGAPFKGGTFSKEARKCSSLYDLVAGKRPLSAYAADRVFRASRATWARGSRLNTPLLGACTARACRSPYGLSSRCDTGHNGRDCTAVRVASGRAVQREL